MGEQYPRKERIKLNIVIRNVNKKVRQRRKQNEEKPSKHSTETGVYALCH